MAFRAAALVAPGVFQVAATAAVAIRPHLDQASAVAATAAQPQHPGLALLVVAGLKALHQRQRLPQVRASLLAVLMLHQRAGPQPLARLDL